MFSVLKKRSGYRLIFAWVYRNYKQCKFVHFENQKKTKFVTEYVNRRIYSNRPSSLHFPALFNFCALFLSALILEREENRSTHEKPLKHRRDKLSELSAWNAHSRFEGPEVGGGGGEYILIRLLAQIFIKFHFLWCPNLIISVPALLRS